MATVELVQRENMLLAAKMTHNQQIIDVAEVLNETNDVLQDAIVMQANDITSHVISRRTALPGSQWVKVGNGWNATVGTLNQVREEIGIMKARYACPQDVMDLQPNPAKYRMQQERAYIESMGQELSNTLFGNYDSSGDLDPAVNPPEEFAGFQRRYSTLSTAAEIGTGAADASYVLNNGNDSGVDNTSIYFVQWGPSRVYLTHPRNTGAGGLKKEDKGLNLVSGDNSVASTSATGNNPTNQLWSYLTEFDWKVGLAIEDTRSVKRLANIDSVHGSTNTLDDDKVIQIRNNFKGNDTIYMYCNEQTYTQLQILAKDKSNVYWGENNPFGKPQLYFLDMPVRRCDAISNNEPILTE